MTLPVLPTATNCVKRSEICCSSYLGDSSDDAAAEAAAALRRVRLVVLSKLVAYPSCARAHDALTTHLRTGLGLNAVKGLDTVCWEHRCEIAIVDH